MKNLAAAAILAAQAGLSFAATPAQWRSQSIYFAVTDRFARTDGSTTAACDLSAGKYCGGSWQGLINKLDYIQGMGFTAIWITPITHNIETKSGAQAFHGYWQDDLYAVNEHYGTEADLKALSKALHDRGMYLMVDVVANHFGYDSANANSVQYEAYRPFNNSQYFHKPCKIDYNSGSQSSIENCWLVVDSSPVLPDLDTTRQDVKNLYNTWIKDLVSKYSIDGLRVDTVKHVNKDFWKGFNSASGVYNVGEVLDGNPSYLCDYQNYMDGLLNYALWFPLTRAFQSTSGSMTDLANEVNSVKSTCKDTSLLGTFLENHDQPRFPSLTQDMSLVKNAMAFNFLADGIPILYYGQEQHYAGQNDPYNREPLWTSGYNTNSDLYKFVTSLNKVRSNAIKKDTAYPAYQSWPIYTDSNTIVMRKGSDGKAVIGVFSNKGANGNSYQLNVPNTGYASGSQVMDIVTCSRVTVNSNGSLNVAMSQGAPRIFYPVSQLSGSGLCGL